MPRLVPPRPHVPGRPRRPSRPRRTLRPGRPGRGGTATTPRIVVLGDLIIDVVVAPSRPIELGTDVPGRVAFIAGGSATNTARWLARLGADATLVASVGRDAAGRALVETIRRDGVHARVARIAGAPTGRIGVVVAPDGERSFVQDRGAAALLRPEDLQAAWFAGIDALHMPTYSLIGEPLGQTGRAAIQLARAGGATVSIDLASVGPLLANGRRGARALIEEVAPDILFATAVEAEAFLGRYAVEGLLELAPIAVVKRGSKGATVLAREGDGRLRLEVATEHVVAADTTGAGDAFDAGFLSGWFAARAAGRSLPAALQRAAITGHRTATRQLRSVRPELSFG